MTEIMQFFSPHVFFNLSCWGIKRISNLMNDIKLNIEKLSPEQYRLNKDSEIAKVLEDNGARDSEMSVQANLELLDLMAFGFADLYQEYRNRLFFTEDILKKQYEELEVLERAEAKENIRKKRLFYEKGSGLRKEKTKLQKMSEDLGIYLEEEEEFMKDPVSHDNELFELKTFLENNGISKEYLNKVVEFGKNHLEEEKKKR